MADYATISCYLSDVNHSHFSTWKQLLSPVQGCTVCCCYPCCCNSLSILAHRSFTCARQHGANHWCCTVSHTGPATGCQEWAPGKPGLAKDMLQLHILGNWWNSRKRWLTMVAFLKHSANCTMAVYNSCCLAVPFTILRITQAFVQQLPLQSAAAAASPPLSSGAAFGGPGTSSAAC